MTRDATIKALDADRARLAESNAGRHVCPDCGCSFVQPFRCVTCGAQKLYDNTVLSLERSVAFYKAENERLLTALRIIAGFEQCIDNTLGNIEIARRTLSNEGE